MEKCQQYHPFPAKNLVSAKIFYTFHFKNEYQDSIERNGQRIRLPNLFHKLDSIFAIN